MYRWKSRGGKRQRREEKRREEKRREEKRREEKRREEQSRAEQSRAEQEQSRSRAGAEQEQSRSRAGAEQSRAEQSRAAWVTSSGPFVGQLVLAAVSRFSCLSFLTAKRCIPVCRSDAFRVCLF